MTLLILGSSTGIVVAVCGFVGFFVIFLQYLYAIIK